MRRGATWLAMLVLSSLPAAANHGDRAVFASEEPGLLAMAEVINGNPVWEVRMSHHLGTPFVCQFGGTLEVGGAATCQAPHTLFIVGTGHFHPYLGTPLDVHGTFLVVDDTLVPVTVAIVGL